MRDASGQIIMGDHVPNLASSLAVRRLFGGLPVSISDGMASAMSTIGLAGSPDDEEAMQSETGDTQNAIARTINAEPSRRDSGRGQRMKALDLVNEVESLLRDAGSLRLDPRYGFRQHRGERLAKQAGLLDQAKIFSDLASNLMASGVSNSGVSAQERMDQDRNRTTLLTNQQELEAKGTAPTVNNSSVIAQAANALKLAHPNLTDEERLMIAATALDNKGSLNASVLGALLPNGGWTPQQEFDALSTLAAPYADNELLLTAEQKAAQQAINNRMYQLIPGGNTLMPGAQTTAPTTPGGATRTPADAIISSLEQSFQRQPPVSASRPTVGIPSVVSPADISQFPDSIDDVDALLMELGP